MLDKLINRPYDIVLHELTFRIGRLELKLKENNMDSNYNKTKELTAVQKLVDKAVDSHSADEALDYAKAANEVADALSTMIYAGRTQ